MSASARCAPCGLADGGSGIALSVALPTPPSAEIPMSTRFKPVRPAPNNVSSRADPADQEHHVAPLEGCTLEEACAAIESLPRVQKVDGGAGYAHYVFTTLVFRFKDDVQVEQGEGCIHIRSASRVGHSDLGTNRRRVEQIRSRLAARTP